MWTLIQIELFKIFKKPRTYISFAAIAALIFTIQLGLKLDGAEYIDFVLSSLKQSFDFQGNILNGYLVCYIILQLLLIHVPLLIALIAGDMISGEADAGTLRLLLTKPFSRTQLLLAKFFAAAFYTLLLLVWMAAFALFMSMWLFGTNDLFIVKTYYAVQLRADDVFWRYLAAFGFAYLAMLTVAALAFLLSVFAENSIGPIVATMSVIIFFTVLSTMNIPLYEKIQPYLFTTHMVNWKEFFDEKVDANNVPILHSIQNPGYIFESVLVLIGHVSGFVSLAIFIFNKKDILS